MVKTCQNPQKIIKKILKKLKPPTFAQYSGLLRVHLAILVGIREGGQAGRLEARFEGTDFALSFWSVFASTFWWLGSTWWLLKSTCGQGFVHVCTQYVETILQREANLWNMQISVKSSVWTNVVVGLDRRARVESQCTCTSTILRD